MWFEVDIVEDSRVRYEDRTAKLVVLVVTSNFSVEKRAVDSFALFYYRLYNFEDPGVRGSRVGFKPGVRLFLVARPQKTTGRCLAAS
jgi:hypothetical protein